MSQTCAVMSSGYAVSYPLFLKPSHSPPKGAHRILKNYVKYSCIHSQVDTSIRFTLLQMQWLQLVQDFIYIYMYIYMCVCMRACVCLEGIGGVQVHSVSFCESRKIVKLFRNVLSPCNSVQDCTFC
jgi:hypothetical protein